ncbi:MAG: LacI family DNA-binding transcriptional regulator [Lachnospiraceae bacterium]|nr:LacI family DNA-binding transcriptional regulator [Lachnospiraceae bacterium]
MAKTITMRDIAAKVGVSTVTVSKALGDKDGVGSELRTLIKETADEMGYHYSMDASSFRKGRNYRIGVLMEEHFTDDNSTALSFYMRLYHSVVVQLSRFHYSVLLEMITPQMLEKMQMPNVISEMRMDGLIVIGKVQEEYLKLIRESRTPLVYLDFYDKNLEVPSVISDNVYGSYLLTEYLIGLGHTRFAFLGSIDATPSIMDRYLGYYRALVEHGLKQDEKRIISDRGKDGLGIPFRLPERPDMPTAFVCNCDETAYTLIEQLYEMGYRVPEDISVVGFDNYVPGAYALPKLTTMDVDMDEMSRQAVEILIRLMKGQEQVFGRKVVGGKMIIRESAARVKE